jgi:hypothetical protein
MHRKHELNRRGRLEWRKTFSAKKRFPRITPVVNWHMSDNVRLEFVYGYGSLNRFDLVGKTQFLQSRIQLQF